MSATMRNILYVVRGLFFITGSISLLAVAFWLIRGGKKEDGKSWKVRLSVLGLGIALLGIGLLVDLVIRRSI